MVSHIRMWIVNIVNLCRPSSPALLVAWWDVADWMEQEIIVSRSHEHCTKCQILHHNTRHTIQPTTYSLVTVQCGTVEQSLDTVKFNSSLGWGRQLGFVL